MKDTKHTNKDVRKVKTPMIVAERQRHSKTWASTHKAHLFIQIVDYSSVLPE